MALRPEKSKIESTAPVRLHRFLAQAGVASRRRAEEFISAGRISVNGEVVTKLGTVIDPQKDKVAIDGELLRREIRRLFLLHKPRGVITTMSDPQGRPTIADYTREINVRLYPVGRLDFDVSGLLILTNDGDLAHQLLHPKFGIGRTYWARIKGAPDEKVLHRLLKGVDLEPEKEGEKAEKARALAYRLLQPSERIDLILGPDRGTEPASLIELEVGEGRKHLVKLLFKAIGHPVLNLARVKHGEYNLGDLKPGELRELGQEPQYDPRKRPARRFQPSRRDNPRRSKAASDRPGAERRDAGPGNGGRGETGRRDAGERNYGRAKAGRHGSAKNAPGGSRAQWSRSDRGSTLERPDQNKPDSKRPKLHTAEGKRSGPKRRPGGGSGGGRGADRPDRRPERENRRSRPLRKNPRKN